LTYFYAIFIFFLFSGCASYRVPTEELAKNDLECRTSKNFLYKVVPRHPCQICPLDIFHTTTWVLFGNNDDGLFGEGANFCPQQPPTFSKALRWWCRNPVHNFCFYVIGSADRVNSEFDILQIVDNKISGLHYRSVGYKTFASEGTSLYIALHGGKPFISLRLRYHPRYRADFYIGWRERGNFGIKFAPICRG
jgi:hypothetical protein